MTWLLVESSGTVNAMLEPLPVRKLPMPSTTRSIVYCGLQPAPPIRLM